MGFNRGSRFGDLPLRSISCQKSSQALLCSASPRSAAKPRSHATCSASGAVAGMASQQWKKRSRNGAHFFASPASYEGRPTPFSSLKRDPLGSIELTDLAARLRTMAEEHIDLQVG